MRIAIIADSHFDEAPGGRFEECIRIHDWIAADLEVRGVELVLHSGDVFERKSTPTERARVADWLRRVATNAPVVIVRGNHDALGDVALFERLRTKHPVIVEEAASVRRVADVAVACIAWPRKAELLAAGGDDPAEALRNVLRGLGDELAQAPRNAPRILLAHAQVRGSRVSTGQPLVGCEMEIGLEDLALARADLYALGHIHLPQAWEIDGAPVVYPGSPRRTAFGETEEKGYVLAEFDGSELVGWERVPTPCAGMELVEAEWRSVEGRLVGDMMSRLAAAASAGAEVRLRYSVDADQREPARTAASALLEQLLADGALTVKLEEVVRPRSTARAPEVARAVSIAEKLDALWRARADVPEPERGARLVAMAQQVEVEVRHAA